MRAGQRGAARAATREGARREGAESAPAGRGGSRPGGVGARPLAQWGLGIPTKALEEVMRRSLGARGPGARGSSPHCAAAVRCPVPAGLSEAQGPAAPAPPPSALPRRGPAPPRPARRPPRRAPATPCASAGLLTLGAPFPTEALILGLAHSALPGAEKGADTGPGARTKGPRLQPSGNRERTRENRTALRWTAVRPPSPYPSGEGREVRPSTSRPLLRPVGWLDPGTQKSGMVAALQAGGPLAAQRSDLGDWGPHLLLPPQGPGPKNFFPGMKVSRATFLGPNQSEDQVAPGKPSYQQTAFSSLGEAPCRHSPAANFAVGVGRGCVCLRGDGSPPLPHVFWSPNLETCPPVCSTSPSELGWPLVLCGVGVGWGAGWPSVFSCL